METQEPLTHDRSVDPSMTYLGLGRRKADRLSQKLSPHLASRPLHPEANETLSVSPVGRFLERPREAVSGLPLGWHRNQVLLIPAKTLHPTPSNQRYSLLWKGACFQAQED